MRRPDVPQRAAAIALHDVSPATWPECRRWLTLLDNLAARPLTLLVVPEYHHCASAMADRGFVRAMDERLARGDELVLHGLYHLDEARAPRNWRGFVERRLLTRSEGEFAALEGAAAASRIARGVAMFAALGWPLHGFVPPAWLMSEPAREALADCAHRFDYMTVRSGIYRLPGWRFETTANLCYSPTNAARRTYSSLAIRRELRRARRMPLLRLSLHPQDAREPSVLRHWERLVVDTIAERRLVTKREWVAFRDRPVPAALLQPGGAGFAGEAVPSAQARAIS